MRYYFIVNPLSGSGCARRNFEHLRACMEDRGLAYAYAYTEYPGHATALAEAALLAGEPCIVAVGGDGTVQQVARALAQSEAVMGVCAFGTGNDFARAFGLPSEPEDALEALLHGVPRLVDLGFANEHCFTNVAGFGFDVDVVRYTEKYKRHMNGMLPYLLGIIQALLHLKPMEVCMHVENQEIRERALLVSACNCTHFAGGIHVAPQADPCDGKLDICVVRAMSIPVFLTVLPRYIKGKHIGNPHIGYFKAESLALAVDGVDTMDLDGELFAATPARFCVQPGALRLITGDRA